MFPDCCDSVVVLLLGVCLPYVYSLGVYSLVLGVFARCICAVLSVSASVSARVSARVKCIPSSR